jgi:hypothetical protein
MGAQLSVVRALSILGRDEEALPILDAASRAVATASRASPPFDDMSERRALEAWRASVLLTIGRTEEGLGLRAGVADCHCSAADATALARALMRSGRGAEAARWLADAPTAGLGLREQMERSEVAACAAAQTRDGAALAHELGFLAEHEAWQPEARVRALVCADRLDDAQATLTRQLADPRTRLSALASLQAYLREAHEMPFERELADRWAALAARPGLQAEVTKVGRIRRYDLRQWESVS